MGTTNSEEVKAVFFMTPKPTHPPYITKNIYFNRYDDKKLK